MADKGGTRGAVLAVPDIPIFGLDAKSIGSLFEFALIRRIAGQRAGLSSPM